MNSLVTYLSHLLKVDRELVPFSIEALEKKYFWKIPAGPEGERFNIRTGGFIDRVDQVLGIKQPLVQRLAAYFIRHLSGSRIAELLLVLLLLPVRKLAVFYTLADESPIWSISLIALYNPWGFHRD